MNAILGIIFFACGCLAVYVYQRQKYKKFTEEDFVCEVIQKSFFKSKYTDFEEHKRVRELLKGESFVKDLSLTAKYKGMIIGYILLTEVKLGKDKLLLLYPVCVLPKFQKKGVGKSLIEKGEAQGKAMGYKGVVVSECGNLFGKMGYEKADTYGIEPPKEIDKERFLIKELKEGSLKNMSGTVEYPKEFFIK